MNLKKSEIITVVFVGIFIGAAAFGGYLHGKKIMREAVNREYINFNARLDSLRCIELNLLDSLQQVARKRASLKQVITVYQTRYDTIHVKSDPDSILAGFTKIIHYMPPLPLKKEE